MKTNLWKQLITLTLAVTTFTQPIAHAKAQSELEAKLMAFATSAKDVSSLGRPESAALQRKQLKDILSELQINDQDWNLYANLEKSKVLSLEDPMLAQQLLNPKDQSFELYAVKKADSAKNPIEIGYSLKMVASKKGGEAGLQLTVGIYENTRTQLLSTRELSVQAEDFQSKEKTARWQNELQRSITVMATEAEAEILEIAKHQISTQKSFFAKLTGFLVPNAEAGSLWDATGAGIVGLAQLLLGVVILGLCVLVVGLTISSIKNSFAADGLERMGLQFLAVGGTALILFSLFGFGQLIVKFGMGQIASAVSRIGKAFQDGNE